MARVCPWWLGYFLVSPLRRLYQDPAKILKPYINKGSTILEIGCGMGYFTLPMAGLTGKSGRVICVDVQEKMLKSLERRAKKSGLSDLIETRLCSEDSFGIDDLAEQVDFVLLFAMVHEVPDSGALLAGVYKVMRKNAQLLISEPKGHVKKEDFNNLISSASSMGFEVVINPKIKGSLSVLLLKK